MKRIILITILIFAVNTVFGQKAEKKVLDQCSGVSTGKAIHLPKPPPRIWESCNCKFDNEIEEVVVQVTISEEGIVEEANAISGHPFLRSVSEQSAKNSRFSPTVMGCEKMKTYTEITYSFNLKDNSIFYNTPQLLIKEIKNLGIINNYVTSLPMPKRPFGNYKVSNDSSIGVQVKVDLQNGKVIEAKAIYGLPLFGKVAEDVALQAKFDFKSKWSYAKFGIGVLDYKVKDFIGNDKITDTNKIVNKKAIYLPKPSLVMIGGKHLRLSKDEIVKVEIIVDEQGNVSSAKAVSGHILLRQACESAARKAKFNPTNDVGIIKVKAFLVYKIKPNGEVEM